MTRGDARLRWQRLALLLVIVLPLLLQFFSGTLVVVAKSDRDVGRNRHVSSSKSTPVHIGRNHDEHDERDEFDDDDGDDDDDVAEFGGSDNYQDEDDEKTNSKPPAAKPRSAFTKNSRSSSSSSSPDSASDKRSSTTGRTVAIAIGSSFAIMAGCLLFHCCVSRQMDKQMSAVAHSQYSYPVDSMPSPSSQQMSEVYAHTSDGHRSGSSTLVRRDSDAEVRARRRTGTASASAAAMAKRPISGSSPLTGPVMLPEHFNSEYEREMHERSLAYERAHPFGSVPTSITDDQQQAILDYGVAAWEMVVDATQAAQVSVVERMDVVFNAAAQESEMEPAAPVTVQSNLPIPRIESTYYFEVKLASLPLGTTVVVGVSTKPYPLWRACGWNKYSIGFFTDTGNVFQDSPFCMLPVGEPCNENDIIGIGYQPNNGTLFFTRNGRRFRTVITGIHYDLFPTVSAVNGPARVSVNVGQVGFVFVEANVKKWGFAALEGAMSPPPAYGDNRGSLLLSSDDVLPIASVSSSEASSTSVQLHLHQPIQLPQHDPERMNALGDLSSSDEQPSPSNSNNLRHSVLVDNPWNLLTPPTPPPPAYPH